MESLQAYLTKDGWKEDWKKTKDDFNLISEDLSDVVVNHNPKGDAFAGILVAIAAMPACAYLGSYVGEGAGWLWGNIVGFVPYVNDVAPWLAERTGLVKEVVDKSTLNEDLYQTLGATSGFWGGLWFPWKVLANMDKE